MGQLSPPKTRGPSLGNQLGVSELLRCETLLLWNTRSSLPVPRSPQH